MELAFEEVMKEVEESIEGIKDCEHFISFPQSPLDDLKQRTIVKYMCLRKSPLTHSQILSQLSLCHSRIYKHAASETQTCITQLCTHDNIR